MRSSEEGHLLVVGALGQVGTQLREVLKTSSSGEVLPTSRSGRLGSLPLDLADTQSVRKAIHELADVDLKAIYCLGSMTNVDACESEPEVAMQVNAGSPALLAGFARLHGVPFVYMSSEYVFAGSEDAPGPYCEQSQPNPKNEYGRSKLAGERAVLDAHPDALIVRTTVVYGSDPGERNYLYTVLRTLGAGKQLRVPKDQISTPTYNRDLASVCAGLVKANASGVLHVCGPERIDRLTFAQAIASHYKLDGSLLQGEFTATLGQTAIRPIFAGLECSKLRTAYPHLGVRNIREALADCAISVTGFLKAHA